jgi:hypothetical protein
MRRVLAPTGFGSTHLLAKNTDPQGRALGQRVDVTLLVNKGLQGGMEKCLPTFQVETEARVGRPEGTLPLKIEAVPSPVSGRCSGKTWRTHLATARHPRQRIQFLLGLGSVEIMERYLSSRQRIVHAVNSFGSLNHRGTCLN